MFDDVWTNSNSRIWFGMELKNENKKTTFVQLIMTK